MQLRLSDLPAHLSRGIKPLYIVQGDEQLLVIEAADQIRKAARQEGFLEREVLHFAGRSMPWESLAAATRSMSLFASKKLIEVRLPGGKPGLEGARALIEHSAAHFDDIATLVLLPKLDGNARKSTWFTTLEDAGISIAIANVDADRLPAWIGQRLALQGQSADPDTLQMMAERVEGNLLAAFQEIQKLALLCPPGRLDQADVAGAVARVARYDVFKLREALLRGDLARVQRMFDGLQSEGESPVLVHWALADQIRVLVQAEKAMASGRRLPDIARELRLWDGREQLLGVALKRLSALTLERALMRAAELERAIKGLRVARYSGDAWADLFELAREICSPQKAPAHVRG
jgi:DNA polymerase-3 subunit delta